MTHKVKHIPVSDVVFFPGLVWQTDIFFLIVKVESGAEQKMKGLSPKAFGVLDIKHHILKQQ